MPKTKISEFSSTPANNTDIDSINIAEGCAPSGINDAIRELMSQLKDWQAGTSNDPMVIGTTGSLTLNQGTANGVTYLNGSKVVTSGTAMVFDGANLAVGISTGYRTPTGFNTVAISGSTGGAVDLYSGSTRVGGIGSTGTATYVSSVTATPLIFSTNDTEKMRLDSSGNLGLGVTPSAWSTGISTKAIEFIGSSSVYGQSGTDIGFANNAYYNSGWLYRATGTAMLARASSGAFQWFTAPSGTAGNAITFTQAMTLDTNGALLVGQTSQSQTTVGFSVTQSGVVSSALAASTSAANSYHLYSTGAGAYRFYVGMGGTINATNTSITGISDVRLKENIRDLDDGLDVVIALKPRKFDWKEGKGANTKNARGFIAQEFEQVLPDMIEEWLDPAPEGEDPYKAVNANLIPTLVKAIQELNTKFEAYKASHP
jgi:hypothetical protein